MNDNEKRAHDFAIAMLPIFYDDEIKKIIATADPSKDAPIVERGIDIFKIYKDTYESALDAFNNNYPDSK